MTVQSPTARWLRSLPSLQGSAPSFDVVHVPDGPATLFLDWLHGAAQAGVPEPHAATFATVDTDGGPDVRTLILKDVTATSWGVAGPRSSTKARQLAANPVAALNFWWQPLLRAVRMRGAVVEASREEIESDLLARPTTVGRSADDWMLWWIRPVRVEFWQGSPRRNHTRLVYQASGEGWVHGTLGGAAAPSGQNVQGTSLWG